MHIQHSTAFRQTNEIDVSAPGWMPYHGMQSPVIVDCTGAKWFVVQYSRAPHGKGCYVVRHHYAQPDQVTAYGPLANGQGVLYLSGNRLFFEGWQEREGQVPVQRYFVFPDFPGLG